jgi:hypothetical protein
MSREKRVAVGSVFLGGMGDRRDHVLLEVIKASFSLTD